MYGPSFAISNPYFCFGKGCTPNWGVDCVLAYNLVILCHFICCNIFYRAFAIVLLHYSCMLLSLMSCLCVLSLMSCLIVLSFMSCLITLALVVFWVRHIPQECTTYSGCSLRWVCTIELGILSPCHVHWHITSVIPFYFNFGSNLIISVLVEAYSLVTGLSL